jgi:hypothetical protein
MMGNILPQTHTDGHGPAAYAQGYGAASITSHGAHRVTELY